MNFKIIENGVVVEENGFHVFVPKHMLDTINNEAQKEWYYKQDVVDYLKEHYNYALLAEREPEIINELVGLYAGLRKINEGCFNWEECLKQAFKEFKDPYTLEQYSLEAPKFVAFNITWDTGYDSADVLPKAVLIPAAFTNENEITDYLCEVYDACGCGFDLKELG
jgi:hypothetical protein